MVGGVGPIAFILVFLIVPLAAGLVVLALVAASLAAKALAALPLLAWGLVLAAVITAELGRRTLRPR